MASIINPQDEDQDEKEQAGPQQVTSGQTAVVGQEGASASSPTGTKSGRFTNISNYLKANQGYNAQGGGLAGKIAGNIQNKGQEVKQQVGQAKSEFDASAQKNRTQFDENTVNSALKDPSSFVQNGQNVDKFQQQLNAKYQGPTDLQNVDSLQNKAQNLQNLTKQTVSEGGRFDLLKQMFNKPTYTGGQQRLDNLLLQGNQNQLKNLTGTRRIGGEVATQFGGAREDAISKAQAFKDEAAATAQQTQERLSTENQTRQAALEQQRLDQEASRKTLLDRLGMGLKNRELSQEDLSRFGLQEGQETYGVDLASYLTPNASEATLQNTASREQALNMNALAQLAGKEATFDPEAAGTFGQNQYNFAKDALSGDLSQRKATYERQVADQNNLVQQAFGSMGGSQQQVDQARYIKSELERGVPISVLASVYGGEDEINRDLQNLAQLDAAQAGLQTLNQTYGIGNTIKRTQ